MVYVSEFLPNPVGRDTEGEWLELHNNGPEAISLDGWQIVTQSGKKFSLSGRAIGGGEYLILPRSETKLALRNQNGSLFLYDGAGRLVDEAGFLGSAPEGKSFARAHYDHDHDNDDNHDNGVFIFTEPTPGALNAAVGVRIIRNIYPLGRPLNPQIGGAEVLGLMVGTAVVLTALVMFVLKRNEDLSKLFFGRD